MLFTFLHVIECTPSYLPHYMKMYILVKGQTAPSECSNFIKAAEEYLTSRDPQSLLPLVISHASLLEKVGSRDKGLVGIPSMLKEYKILLERHQMLAMPSEELTNIHRGLFEKSVKVSTESVLICNLYFYYLQFNGYLNSNVSLMLMNVLGLNSTQYSLCKNLISYLDSGIDFHKATIKKLHPDMEHVFGSEYFSYISKLYNEAVKTQTNVFKTVGSDRLLKIQAFFEEYDKVCSISEEEVTRQHSKYFKKIEPTGYSLGLPNCLWLDLQSNHNVRELDKDVIAYQKWFLKEYANSVDTKRLLKSTEIKIAEIVENHVLLHSTDSFQKLPNPVALWLVSWSVMGCIGVFPVYNNPNPRFPLDFSINDHLELYVDQSEKLFADVLLPLARKHKHNRIPFHILIGAINKKIDADYLIIKAVTSARAFSYQSLERVREINAPGCRLLDSYLQGLMKLFQ